MKNSAYLRTLILLIWMLVSLAACRNQPATFVAPTTGSGPITATSPPLAETEIVPTEVVPTQAPTQLPLALAVNQDVITLTEYQAALERFQLAQPDVPLEEAQASVQNEFIDQLLLAQAAVEMGFVVDDALLKERIAQLANQVGGEQALADWQAANGYSAQSFWQEMAREIPAAWMRDQVIGQVPDTSEQVHARQILLYNFGEAQSVHDQLLSGAGFDDMLAFYDPVGLGDLGWFPRGYLREPEIEAAAFALEPGAISEIIETDLGFHILQVVERLPDRPLDPDAKRTLQAKALDAWLKERREQSEITVFVP